VLELPNDARKFGTRLEPVLREFCVNGSLFTVFGTGRAPIQGDPRLLRGTKRCGAIVERLGLGVELRTGHGGPPRKWEGVGQSFLRSPGAAMMPPLPIPREDLGPVAEVLSVFFFRRKSSWQTRLPG